MIFAIKKRLREIATRNEVPVFNYHGVIPQTFPFQLPYQISKSRFREHIAWFARNRRCLSLDELSGHLAGRSPIDDKCVAITFDDGFANNLYQALPVLEEFGVPATVFVASGFIGKGTLLWPERVAIMLSDARLDRLTIGGQMHDLSTPDHRTEAYMALTRLLKSCSPAEIDDEIRVIQSGSGLDMSPDDSPFADDFRPLDGDEFDRLASHELMSIGCHTINHHRLSQLPSSEARFEIIDSKRDLESRDAKVDYFAYPFGGFGADFDESHVEAVRKGGYQGAFSIGVGGAAPGCNPYLIPRINVTSNIGLSSLEYLAGGGGSLAGAGSAMSLVQGLVTGTVRQGAIQ